MVGQLFSKASASAAFAFAMLAPSVDASGGAGWLVVPPQSLEIAEGSPLDFSSLLPRGQAGEGGRVALSPRRGLIFEGTGKAAKFNCAMIANGAHLTQEFPAHAEALLIAKQFRRHGYNLVRFHNVDMRLTLKATSDFSPDEEQLDRFYYLLAALKAQGIYWMIDGITKPNGGVARASEIKSSPDDLKVRINFDDAARGKWLKLVDAVYSRINPYTGNTVLADPALAFVVGANENSIAFWSNAFQTPDKKFPSGIDILFDSWVRAKYSTHEQLKRVLPQGTPDEISGKRRISLPNSWRERDARMELFLSFASTLEVATYQWMQARLRERGFVGALLAFPEWAPQSDNRTRSQLPITDVHAYVGEVSSYALGKTLSLPSATSNEGMGAWLINAGARWLDRPMVVSEYGQPFPNPYRYEAGIVFPAIAAFQGYSSICRTAHLSVESDVRAPSASDASLVGYSVGADPIARAGETLASMIFFRGDVKPGDAAVQVRFGAAEMRRPGSAILPRDLRTLALLSRFGLTPPETGSVRRKKHGIALELDVPDQSEGQKLVGNALARVNFPEKTLDGYIERLRSVGVLGPNNLTNQQRRVYQSSTEEMTLDQEHGQFRVVTARTEAVSTTSAARAISLKSLTVLSTDSGALVAATSLHGRKLSGSDSILLILAGDARNSNMVLSGSGQKRVVQSWGRQPVVLQRVRAHIQIRVLRAEEYRFSVLSLNGNRVSSWPVMSDDTGRVDLTLDTGAMAAQPTTFFLLERAQ